MSLLLTFVTSLMLGMRHATDSDHIVAVTAIASREKSVAKAAWLGAVWGFGHTLTLFLVGGAIIAFKIAFSPRVGLSMELAVAVMLIVLGLLNLLEVRPRSMSVSSTRPFLVGLVHGLAGSAAAVLVVVPLIPDPRWAALYLVVFGLGTVMGMTLITLSIAAPSFLLASRMSGMQRSLRLASGAVSLVSGFYLVQKIGFGDGLFTRNPVWTPQ
ncbi:MAG: high-affinity nickel-transport family protein [Gemmatimonadaceae bacterium]